MGKVKKSKEGTAETGPMASNTSLSKKHKIGLSPRTPISGKASSESAARKREMALRVIKWLKVAMEKNPWRKTRKDNIVLSGKPKEEGGATSLTEEKEPQKKKNKERQQGKKMMQDELKMLWDEYNQIKNEMNALRNLKIDLSPRTPISGKASSESPARDREKALRVHKWLKVAMEKNPWRKTRKDNIALSGKPKEEGGATSLTEEKEPQKKKNKQRQQRKKMMQEKLKMLWDEYNKRENEMNALWNEYFQLHGDMKILCGHPNKQLQKKGNTPHTLCNQGNEVKKEVISDFHQVKAEMFTHFSQDNQVEKKVITHFDPNSPKEEVKFTQVDQDKQVKGVISHFNPDQKVNELITHCYQGRKVKEWWVTLYYQEEQLKEEKGMLCYQEMKVKGERITLWLQENRVKEEVITIFRQGKKLIDKMNSITAQEQEGIDG